MQENFHLNQHKNIQVLVTGSAGLVGNELVNQLLDKGFRVKAIYNSTKLSISHPDLETVQCDILDVVRLEEIMEGITQVYHCAAIVSFDPKDKYRVLKMNVEGTTNVVNACIDASVKKLVHVSSVAALGRIRNGQTVTEKMNWTPETSNSVYGKSKYFGELEVWRGLAEGLKTVIVNPSIILGADNWETGSTALFKTVYNEFKWYAEGVSGFVDVRDVANAMILLMNSDISGQRYILNSECISYKELFFSIAKCFGKKPPPKKVTPFLAEIAWRIEALKTLVSGKKHLLTKETARTAQSKIYYDNSKILKALPGFEFIQIKDTIERTCKILKEKYNLE